MSYLMSTNKSDRSTPAEVWRTDGCVSLKDQAWTLMETVAPGPSEKMTAIFKSLPTTSLEIQRIKQNNWLVSVVLIGRSVYQTVWEAIFKTPVTMPGHSFQAGLSIYRADIKLHFTR